MLAKCCCAVTMLRLPQCLAFYQQHFPDRYYLELIRTGRQDEETYLHAAVELAIANSIARGRDQRSALSGSRRL